MTGMHIKRLWTLGDMCSKESFMTMVLRIAIIITVIIVIITWPGRPLLVLVLLGLISPWTSLVLALSLLLGHLLILPPCIPLRSTLSWVAVVRNSSLTQDLEKGKTIWGLCGFYSTYFSFTNFVFLSFDVIVLQNEA